MEAETQAPRRAHVNEVLAQAVEAQRAKRYDDAQRIYELILAQIPNQPDALHLFGVLKRSQGDAPGGMELIRRALEIRPDFPVAQSNYANALRDGGNALGSLDYYDRAITAMPDEPSFRVNRAHSLRLLGRDAEAEADLTYALARAPNDIPGLTGMAALYRDKGRIEEASQLLARLTALDPTNPRAVSMHASVEDARGNREEAYRLYLRSAELAPDDPVILAGAGHGIRCCGRIPEAIAFMRAALERLGEHADLLYALALTLDEIRDYPGAEDAFKRCLAARPQHLDCMATYAHLLLRKSQLIESEAMLRAALAIQPDKVEALSNLGSTLQSQGRYAESLEYLRRATELRPDMASPHSNLIFSAGFVPEVPDEEQVAMRRQWYERHGLPFAKYHAPFTNDRDPNRRLRVGYVSGDFRHHPAAFVFVPVLLNHDPAEIELFAYQTTMIQDDLTVRLKAAIPNWRVVHGVSDPVMIDMVRRDQIDILVDCVGHTMGNRLQVFAAKPAPVQVSAFGHATGTGVATIDYVFADPVTVPERLRGGFVEKVLDLPCVMDFDPLLPLPDVGPLPMLQNGYPTFGCFNRLAKVGPGPIALWGRILRDRPDARLVLKDRLLSDAEQRRRIVEGFAAQGIAAERLTLIGQTDRPNHLAAYAQIDAALDPFPQTGGITTIEALWMGAPVVSWIGPTLPQRFSAAVLMAAGLGGWVSPDQDGYVARALDLVRDPARLAGWRARLRGHMQVSPIGDTKAYTKAVEAHYRGMWQRWCAQQG